MYTDKKYIPQKRVKKTTTVYEYTLNRHLNFNINFNNKIKI